MAEVLLKWPSLSRQYPELKASLCKLRFLPSQADTASRHYIEELYDPQQPRLQALNLGPEHFPSPHFTTPELLPILSRLGLRARLSGEHLVAQARRVGEIASRDVKSAYAQAETLLIYLDGTGILEEVESLPEVTELRMLAWLPVAGCDSVTKPAAQFLATAPQIAAPTQLVGSSHRLLVCCVHLVLPQFPRAPSPKLSRFLGLD